MDIRQPLGAVGQMSEAAAMASLTQNFLPDFKGKPSDPWNKAATKVFVDDFITNSGTTYSDRPAISKAFVAYFKTLRRTFNLHSKGQFAVSQSKDQAAHTARREAVRVIWVFVLDFAHVSA